MAVTLNWVVDLSEKEEEHVPRCFQSKHADLQLIHTLRGRLQANEYLLAAPVTLFRYCIIFYIIVQLACRIGVIFEQCDPTLKQNGQSSVSLRK